MGHTLGANHSDEGYMVDQIGKEGASDEFKQENIDQMIKQDYHFGPEEQISNMKKAGFWDKLKEILGLDDER
jgi:hypothetical protein